MESFGATLLLLGLVLTIMWVVELCDGAWSAEFIAHCEANADVVCPGISGDDCFGWDDGPYLECELASRPMRHNSAALSSTPRCESDLAVFADARTGGDPGSIGVLPCSADPVWATCSCVNVHVDKKEKKNKNNTCAQFL
ncbi:hypothetical protein TraAM80_07359 [Trypanosoma rangeli]|uniref:Surface protease GP63 n=1 Tax=Trypanosoma rangeli TaxID=5698 RepID=A0A3R7K6R8_TRYRA|nr:uncharacterized protein TraAM80_07359 [Trypanosoma rangeli]RNF00893.1 hypothetical protein TraAM80_07359 [Trypanosoma rangeli]|eukprot:RNF00893.1 hypothetical protein TraAM80_07359 [Trypanosoma rangeli]